MPKVQAYQPFQVGSKPLNIPMQRLDSRGAFGEAIAAGASDLAGSMEEMQDQDDKAVVKERISEYRKHSRNRLSGDEDAFYSRKGRNAYDSRMDMEKDLSGRRDELTKDLSPRQRAMFNQLSQEYLDRDYDGIARHSQKGRAGWLNEQDEAQLIQAQEDLSLYHDDPAPYSRQIKGIINNIAERNGWSPERREVKLKQALSAAHMSAIDNIIHQNPKEAVGYFQKHHAEISRSLWPDIEKKIEGEVSVAEEQEDVEAIYAKFGNDERAGKRHIRETYEGKERDARMRRYKARVNGNREHERVSANEAYRRAIRAVWSNGISSVSPADEEFLKSRGKWDAIGLEDLARTSGTVQHNDYQWLGQNFFNLPPDQQIKVSDEDLKKHMDYKTYSKFISAREKGQDVGPTRSENDLIKARLMEFNIDINDDASKNDREATAEFYEAFDKAIGAFTDHKKRAPSERDRSDIIKELTESWDLYVNKGFFYDDIGGGPAFRTVTEKNIIELEDELNIPRARIPEIIKYLRSRGRPVNKANVKRAHESQVNPDNNVPRGPSSDIAKILTSTGNDGPKVPSEEQDKAFFDAAGGS